MTNADARHTPDLLQQSTADTSSAPYGSAFEPAFASVAADDPRVAYATPASLAPAHRSPSDKHPKSVRTVSIIGGCFAAVAIVNHVLGLSLIYIRGTAVSAEGLAEYWPIIDSVVSLTLAIVLLLSAHQALNFKSGGRRAMIGWAVAYLVYLIVHAQIMFAVVIPATLPQLEQHLTLLTRSDSFPQSAPVVYAIAGSTLIAIAGYPIAVLIVMGRKSAREPFEAAARS